MAQKAPAGNEYSGACKANLIDPVSRYLCDPGTYRTTSKGTQLQDHAYRNFFD